jgi:predicted secreted acid phosphatase
MEAGEDMSTIFIVDIDDTISDGSERYELAGPEPSRKNKSAYDRWVASVNSGMNQDKPVPGMRDLCIAFEMSHTNFIYLTSREDKHYEDTVEWLSQNGFPVVAELVMRPTGNYLETEVFKESMIAMAEARANADAVVVIDDDKTGRLAPLCKANGWTFLKAGGMIP